MDKLINAAKASNTSDTNIIETLKKRLPSKALDGKLVCIVDGGFCDLRRYAELEYGMELNPYRVSVESNPEKIDTPYEKHVDLEPFTLYGHEVDNALMLLGDDYVWVYDEVEFIDIRMDYVSLCEINLTVAKKVTDKNGSEILVDVEESEFKENVRVFKSSNLVVREGMKWKDFVLKNMS